MTSTSTRSFQNQKKRKRKIGMGGELRTGGRSGRDTMVASTKTRQHSRSAQHGRPPLAIIKKLAELTGETFILEYIEEGMGFCGRYTVGQDGDYDEFYNDIKEAPEELRNELGYEEWEEVESV